MQFAEHAGDPDALIGIGFAWQIHLSLVAALHMGRPEDPISRCLYPLVAPRGGSNPWNSSLHCLFSRRAWPPHTPFEHFWMDKI